MVASSQTKVELVALDVGNPQISTSRRNRQCWFLEMVHLMAHEIPRRRHLVRVADI
jgi:hypothetical protein